MPSPSVTSVNLFELARKTMLSASTDSVSVPDLCGITLCDRYQIYSLMNDRGGEADLYHARDTAGAEWVVKLYRRKNAVKENVLSKLLRKKLPHLVYLADCGEYEGFQFTVTPFYGSFSLGSAVAGGVRFSEDEIRNSILPEILEALKTLHELDIIHKDLKPSNIIVSESEGLLLADFGISTDLAGNTAVMTHTGKTILYSAPETVSGTFLRESDYYSLGITLYELATGATPYQNFSADETELRKYIAVQQIPFPEGFPQNLRNLVTGLTYRDLTNRHSPDNPNRRWGYDEAVKWLKGEAVPVPGVVPESLSSGTPHGADFRIPYIFKGQKYFSLSGLCTSLLSSWEDGKKEVARGLLSRHFDVNDMENERQLCEKTEDAMEKLPELSDSLFFKLVYGLSPNISGFYWKNLYYENLEEYGKALLIEALNIQKSIIEQNEHCAGKFGIWLKRTLKTGSCAEAVQTVSHCGSSSSEFNKKSKNPSLSGAEKVNVYRADRELLESVPEILSFGICEFYMSQKGFDRRTAAKKEIGDSAGNVVGEGDCNQNSKVANRNVSDMNVKSEEGSVKLAGYNERGTFNNFCSSEKSADISAGDTGSDANISVTNKSLLNSEVLVSFMNDLSNNRTSVKKILSDDDKDFLSVLAQSLGYCLSGETTLYFVGERFETLDQFVQKLSKFHHENLVEFTDMLRGYSDVTSEKLPYTLACSPGALFLLKDLLPEHCYKLVDGVFPDVNTMIRLKTDDLNSVICASDNGEKAEEKDSSSDESSEFAFLNINDVLYYQDQLWKEGKFLKFYLFRKSVEKNYTDLFSKYNLMNYSFTIPVDDNAYSRCENRFKEMVCINGIVYPTVESLADYYNKISDDESIRKTFEKFSRKNLRYLYRSATSGRVRKVLEETFRHDFLFTPFFNVKVGDLVEFGKYFSENSTIKEPVKWRILAADGNKVLLITDKGIDCKPYHESDKCIIWAKCSLRRWLNTEFLDTCLAEEEQSQVVLTRLDNNFGSDTEDKIFLLSVDETRKYFENDADRICVVSSYAKERGSWSDSCSCCFWWLRSRGSYDGYASCVLGGGGICVHGYSASIGSGSVRPALWLNLEF